MAYMTIFTAPKPFTNPHIAMIQRNAIQCWMHLDPEVEVIMVGDEEGMAEVASEYGIRHLKDVRRNALGTPYVSSIFEQGRKATDSPLMLFVNADMLLLPSIVSIARQVQSQAKHFLVVGQRWDLDVRQPLDFSPAWDTRLMKQVRMANRRHAPSGSDYFIFPRTCYTHLPDFAIGRPAWDNWMIYEARRSGWTAIDASDTIDIIHQDHDYSHLPGGQPPYRLPERYQNQSQAGGQQAVFYLKDANWRIEGSKLRQKPLTWQRFWREVEIFPQARLHLPFLGNLFAAIFHPVKAYQAFRVGISGLKKKMAR